MNRRSVLTGGAAGLLATFGIAPSAGCQYLPAIQGGVITAQNVASGMLAVVDTIDSFVESYFAQHPDPAKQVAVLKGLGRTRQAIALLFDVLSTAKDAMALNVQAAIADAQKAYADLLALTQPLGVTTRAGIVGASLDHDDVLVVPVPESFVVTR